MAKVKASAAAKAASNRQSDEDALIYEPHGNILKLFLCKDPEILVEGPAGTGKSLGILQKVNLCALRYDGSRILCLRKTRVSIRQSLKITWENTVRPHLNGVKYNKDDDEYRYPAGSIVAMGGMDNADKLLSSEWDMIYYQEATESTESEIEIASSRLRYGRMPYQQLIMDVNPDKEKHFLNIRAELGYSTRLKTTHQDNPTLWSEKYQRWTEKGEQYIARLDALHGVRYLRLRLGRWASAEGVVYDEYDEKLHKKAAYTWHHDMTFFWSVDFGYTHPFVAQLWCQNFTGDLILVREIYRTQTLVEDHARAMRKMQHMLRVDPVAVICDHDAEGRATLEKYLNVETKPAHKAISEGVQAVQARLRMNPETGRPRLWFVNYPVDPDPNIQLEQGKSTPTCTLDEIEGYVWNTSGNKKKGEEPVDKDNHGMDALRYLVCYVDGIGDASNVPDILAQGSADGWVA